MIELVSCLFHGQIEARILNQPWQRRIYARSIFAAISTEVYFVTCRYPTCFVECLNWKLTCRLDGTSASAQLDWLKGACLFENHTRSPCTCSENVSWQWMYVDIITHLRIELRNGMNKGLAKFHSSSTVLGRPTLKSQYHLQKQAGVKSLSAFGEAMCFSCIFRFSVILWRPRCNPRPCLHILLDTTVPTKCAKILVAQQNLHPRKMFEGTWHRLGLYCPKWNHSSQSTYETPKETLS